jgi:MFS family permease
MHEIAHDVHVRSGRLHRLSITQPAVRSHAWCSPMFGRIQPWFGLGIGIFFLSYVALQIPGAVLAQRWSTRGMICATMIVSESLTALTGLVHFSLHLLHQRKLCHVGQSRDISCYHNSTASLQK